MATIKERAYIAAGHPLPPKGAMHVPDKLELWEQTFVNGYIKGATEQRDIDIEEFSKRLTEMQGEYITLELINDLIEELKGNKSRMAKMKKYSLEELIAQSTSTSFPTSENVDLRHGIHFICKKLNRNVDQYWCDEVCKSCKEELDLAKNDLIK